MKITTTFVLAAFLSCLNLYGQDRIIFGRVISEDLEPIPGINIENSGNALLGKTDIDGRFKISIPQETDSLVFRFIGMEFTDVRLKKDCDTVEVVMMYDGTYDYKSSKKIDRLRKKRFDSLPSIHSDAVKNGLFNNINTCYDREFEAYKPELDEISRELKEFGEVIKNDFKELNLGDTVVIPFGIDTTGKIISTYYSPCMYCTDKDYEYAISGKIVNKHRRNLTLEIKITDMQPHDSLEYRGKIINVGSEFKYEMKFFEVILE